MSELGAQGQMPQRQRDVAVSGARIEEILGLEAERDAWAKKRPSWRFYLGCVLGVLAGSALLPFVRGALLGLATAGVILVPAQLLIRRIRLNDVDRRLKALRDGGKVMGDGSQLPENRDNPSTGVG